MDATVEHWWDNWRDGVGGVYRRTVAPSSTVYAVTREEAKSEIGIIDDSSQDGRIDRLIRQATEQVENDARRIIMTQTWQAFWDRFPCHELEVRRVPIQSLTFVKYITGGTLTLLSPTLYQADLISEPARIKPAYNAFWPCTDPCTVNAVQIEFVAGYASAAVVPEYIKHVILAVVRRLYKGCEPDGSYWTMIQRMQTFGMVT